ncbi:MAG: nucleotide exchange factor GrpE [Patescibacteria group bacterium]
MAKEEKEISVVTGVFVENEKGEILLIKMPQWGNGWGIPGGHVERNELLEKAALRELWEETGIEAGFAELVGTTEMVEPKDYKKNKHFISFQFRVYVKGRPEIKQNEEVLEYSWETWEQVMNRTDLCSLMRKTVDLMSLKEKCGSCEQLKAAWARARADYDNLQKEIAKQRGEWALYSERQILEEFIPVYGNFKKAFSEERGKGKEESDSWVKGIEFIMKQFEGVLKSHGVEEIKTVGEKFNPELHEAVGEEESDLPEHAVVREVEAGYLMRGKVIKVAKVIVVK